LETNDAPDAGTPASAVSSKSRRRAYTVWVTSGSLLKPATAMLYAR
jgi:hypothetical protein